VFKVGSCVISLSQEDITRGGQVVRVAEGMGLPPNQIQNNSRNGKVVSEIQRQQIFTF